MSITGGAGNDIITAGSGNDIITGAAGADTITGAGGLDTISLGSSDSASDIIIFSSSSGADIIQQFNAGASNGDIMKYTGNLTDRGTPENVTIGSDSTDDLLSADFNINATHQSLNNNKLIVGFNTAVTQNGLSAGTAIDFTGAGFHHLKLLEP